MEQLGGRLLPTAEDYEALFDDRDDRAAEVVVEEAAELLAEARDEPGVEKTGVLGYRAPVSVVVELTEGIEEVCIAFSVVAVPATWVMLIPVWFLPESHFDEWMETAAFPTRALEEGEICLRWVDV
jgi:hypothetical protein